MIVNFNLLNYKRLASLSNPRRRYLWVDSRLEGQASLLARTNGKQDACPPVSLFPGKRGRAFVEEGGDAFAEIVGFTRFDLAFVFEGELGGEIV